MKIQVVVVAEIKPDFVSSQIMRWMKAPYSHAAIIYNNMVYHCIEQGVCVQSLEDGLHDSVIVGSKEIELKCNEETFLAFIEGAKDKDYSETNLIGIALKKLGFGKSFYKYFSDGRSELFCDEFVAWTIETLSDFKFGKDLDLMDVKEMFEALPPKGVA